MVETKEDKKFYKDVEPLIEQLGKIIRENEYPLASCVYCIGCLVDEVAETHFEAYGVLLDTLNCEVGKTSLKK